MTKREYLHHYNKSLVRRSRSGAVRFVVLYDVNGKAYDCWDRPKSEKKANPITVIHKGQTIYL